MGNSGMVAEYDSKQRYAICLHSFEDNRKSKETLMQWYKLLKSWNGKAVGERVQLEDAEAKALLADKTVELDPSDPIAEAVQEGMKVVEEAIKATTTEVLKQHSAEMAKAIPLITGMHDRVQDDPTGGWPTIGHFAQDIKALASKAAPTASEHMKQWLGKAPTSYQNESTGTDGGVLVPPEYSKTVWTQANEVLDILPRCDNYNPSGNTLVFPRDTDNDLSGGSGIKVYLDNEAAQYTQSKFSVDNMEVKLHKLTVLAGVTDELMDDAGLALGQYLTNKVGKKIGYKIGQLIIKGNGVGQPRGLANSPDLISVPIETGQAADTILAENIIKMYSRMYSAGKKNAVWLVHPSCQPQLQTMHIKIGTGGALLYMPPGGLTGLPYGSIFGAPVLETELLAAVGDLGDIYYVDFSQYCAAVKAGGIKMATSIHLWFDYDVTAFKFSFRFGGQSWWKAVYQPATEGATAPPTLSPIITLAVRS